MSADPLALPAGSDAEDLATRDARVLADPTRRRVLRAVAGAGRPVTVAELTELFGFHHTAIRQHLARLVGAGMVEESTAPPAGRGRPHLIYCASPKAVVALQTTGRYQELASMLAEAVRSGDGPRVTGQRIGERHGSVRAGEDTVSVIADEADRLGFEPRVGRTRQGRLDVVLHHCPFQEVAAEDPGTVCQLHLGLAEGISAALGGITVTGLQIRDPYRAGCRLQLQQQDVHRASKATTASAAGPTTAQRSSARPPRTT